jgi:DNA-binding CsgD family transcriptional regulator
MAIWHTLLSWIGLRPTPDLRTFMIPEHLQVSIDTLAQYEGRPVHELLPDIVAAGLTQYSTMDRVWKKWESLSDREKEATAAVCLGYSNGQVAAAMGITEAGVKFHLRNVYAKFRVKNRMGLRRKLAGWKFLPPAKDSQKVRSRWSVLPWIKIPQKAHMIGIKNTNRS